MRRLICNIYMIFVSLSLFAQGTGSIDMQKNETAGKITQTIRGVVTDAFSGRPIPFATAIVLTTTPMLSTFTDSLGVFKFDNVAVGRHDLEISFVGYEPEIIKALSLTSAKESYSEVALKSNVLDAGEIIVTVKANKEKPLNQMVLSGARMISVEEASRYAGGFDDPMRLVSSFAGVSGGGSTSNSISVHGNSPQFLQWKIDGIEVPNPTHFADLTGVGGGVITALSSQVMGNSDFFNGAFPAEYSNSLAGVFDMTMRNGNNQNYEHTAQLGVLGIDVASEGPISRMHGSSYIVNYRYSITELISGLIADLKLKFQDLSFKFNFPTRKAGTFSLWGMGLIDSYSLGSDAVFSSRDDGDIDMQKAILAIAHEIPVGKNAYIKSSIATTYANTDQYMERKDGDDIINPAIDMSNKEINLVFTSYINTKIGPRHINRSGITVTGLFFDVNYNASKITESKSSRLLSNNLLSSASILNSGGSLSQFTKGDAASSMISVFSNSLINITDKLSTSVGVAGQFFSLNNSWAVEPRASFKYTINPRHSLAIAYGLHSRREKLEYYYIKLPKTGDELINKNLDLAKANHFVLSYDWGITDNLHLKIEPYYQYLFDIPVEPNSWFSIINFEGIGLATQLINGGKGRNYGIDITLERYLDKGYYWLFTGSVFSSTYMGGDGVWRSTIYDRTFVLNALFGKEWMVGKNKQNVISANIRLLFQGGKRYTPVDLEESQKIGESAFNMDKIYGEQFSPALTVDLTVGYKWNRLRVSHEFAIKILNATGTPEMYGYYYSPGRDKIVRDDVVIVLPNLSYKIHF